MRSRWAAPAGLTALWLLLVLVSGPRGEFPLSDDWAYAASVRTLIQEGRLERFRHVPASPVAQVVWGALFCLPGGWSYAALRTSSAVLGLAGVLATFALLREAGADRRLAALGALTLAVNPLYLNLSLTFMTDVPFTAWSLAALVFLARDLRRNRVSDLAIGAAFGLAAVLTRQAGAVIPLAFLFACLTTERPTAPRILRGLVPAAVGGAGSIVCHLWAREGGDWLSNDRVRELIAFFTGGVTGAATALSQRFIVASLYVGLFALPFLACAVTAVWPRPGGPARRGAQAALSAVGVGAVALAAHGQWMPLSENMLYDLGLGPPTLWDVYVKQAPNLPRAPSYVWGGVTFLSLVGGAILAGSTATGIAVGRFRRSPAVTLLGATAALYASLLVAAGHLDRHLVLLVPLAVALVSRVADGDSSVPQPDRRALWAGAGLAVAYGLFGAVATRDYFAWNEARWRAIEDALLVRRIPASSLDGGYEWNGLNRYSPAKRCCWWADREPWVIAFGPVPGYAEAARYPYRRLLPPGSAALRLLRRDGPF